jgi:hypothetical protein
MHDKACLKCSQIADQTYTTYSIIPIKFHSFGLKRFHDSINIV